MPLYKYRVIDAEGTAIEGELKAENEEKLLDKLREQDYTVINVSEAGADEPDEFDALTQDVGIGIELGISQKDLTFLARQLSITLKAGLPLLRILVTLVKQSSNRKLKKILHQVGRDIQLGESLTAAMTKHDDVFDPMFLSMISVGEASGTLPETTARLAALMERDRKVKRKIKAAVTYPAFIIVFSAVLSYVLIAMVMPGFIPMFQSAGINIAQDYPITYMLVTISKFLTNPYVVGTSIVGLIILLVAVNIMSKSKPGRYVLDYVKFNFPFVSGLIRISAVTRFCRSFATLSKSGVSLLKSLSLVSGAAGNMVVARAVEKMAKEIQDGEKISVAMGMTKLFPDLVVQMVSIGEEAGTLAEMFDRTADYFEEEMESAIETLTSLMEPTMMIIVGLIVGIFVMGILLPILGIATKFSGG